MDCRLTFRVRKQTSPSGRCRLCALAVPHIQRNTRTSAQRISYNDLLEVAKGAAEAGAKVVTEALDKPRKIQFKGEADLVTETDRAAEDACVEVVKNEFGSHGILGEEGGVIGDTSSEYLWCIDPLDGTTNFAHGYPSFAVSVGVLRNAKPVAACVIEFTGGPKAWGKRTFTAHRNGGAFCNGDPIAVSRASKLKESLLVTGFGYEHDEAWAANMRMFKGFTDKSQGVRRLGAASVDLCHVAMGIVDAYWEYRLKPWDVAAGVLVVEEAGGLVTTMRGTAYSVFERSMLASNDRLHEQILKTTEPETDALLADGIDLGPWFVPKGYRVHTSLIHKDQ